MQCSTARRSAAELGVTGAEAVGEDEPESDPDAGHQRRGDGGSGEPPRPVPAADPVRSEPFDQVDQGQPGHQPAQPGPGRRVQHHSSDPGPGQHVAHLPAEGRVGGHLFPALHDDYVEPPGTGVGHQRTQPRARRGDPRAAIDVGGNDPPAPAPYDGGHPGDLGVELMGGADGRVSLA